MVASVSSVTAVTPSSIDAQDVVRMNRDTLYSSGVFDLDAAPVTITLPDAGKRFMSMQVIVAGSLHDDGRLRAGTLHLRPTTRSARATCAILIRTLVNSEDPQDVEGGQAVQDAIKVEQARAGAFEVPRWDPASQDQGARCAFECLERSAAPSTGSARRERSTRSII